MYRRLNPTDVLNAFQAGLLETGPLIVYRTLRVTTRLRDKGYLPPVSPDSGGVIAKIIGSPPRPRCHYGHRGQRNTREQLNEEDFQDRDLTTYRMRRRVRTLCRGNP